MSNENTDKNAIKKTLKVLIVGLGVLGTRIAKVLSGIDNLSIILLDRDVVDTKNIGSQLFYSYEDIGLPKAEVAAEKIKNTYKNKYKKYKINYRNSNRNPKNSRPSYFHELHELIDFISADITEDLTIRTVKEKNVDVIIDCTDNFDARFSLNSFCVQNAVPLIHCAASYHIGVVYTTLPGTPCLKCIYGDNPSGLLCEGEWQTEVLNWVVNMAVSELHLKILNKDILKGKEINETNKKNNKSNDEISCIFRVYKKSNEVKLSEIFVKKICGCNTEASRETLEKHSIPESVVLCGNDSYMSRIDISFEQAVERLHKIDKTDNKGNRLYNNLRFCKSAIIIDKITLFKDGRIIARTSSVERAKEMIYGLFPAEYWKNKDSGENGEKMSERLTHERLHEKLFEIVYCKEGYFKAIPLSKGRFELSIISKNYNVILQTPIVIVIKTDVGEAVVGYEGEIAFKYAKDVNAITNIAKEIYSTSYKLFESGELGEL